MSDEHVFADDQRPMGVGQVGIESVAPPSIARVALAALIAVTASLLADWFLIRVGIDFFHAPSGYGHFRFDDYGTLTILGIAFASPAWPVVARLSPTPRRVFVRLATVVVVVLWLPDVWLLLRHESARAVAVLVLMHLAIALITYNALVRLAPTRRNHATNGTDRRTARLRYGASSAVWIAMIVGVTVEFIAGVGTAVLVPFSRPSRWLPTTAQVIYVIHAGLGCAIGLAAATLLVVLWSMGRVPRIGALIGFAGIAIAATGGMFATDRALRLLGMGCMFVGSLVACFGYLFPLVENMPAKAEDVGEVAEVENTA